MPKSHRYNQVRKLWREHARQPWKVIFPDLDWPMPEDDWLPAVQLRGTGAEEPSSYQHVGIPQNWGINMIYTERRQDHLKKASEAKAQVARAIDPVARKAWEQIAAGYQELANLAPGKESKWHA